MHVNSFEQLCINFANEVLQQQFNQTIFVHEQEIYKAEGLDWHVISFHDNQGLIDLIGKKPSGLLPICEEHVMLSYKRNDANNLALLQQLHKTHGGEGPKGKGGNVYYAKPRFTSDPTFTVKHFAGDVTYAVDGFIEKNRDALNAELKGMLVHSAKDFVLCLFGSPNQKKPGMEGFISAVHGEGALGLTELSAGDEGSSGNKSSGGGGGGKKSAGSASVSLRFREQLQSLTSTLRSTQPHYIKCIKPNPLKAPGAVSPKLVAEQLRYSGVLEVVRIRREAYPTRLFFLELFVLFKDLVRCAMEGEHRRKCEAAGLLPMAPEVARDGGSGSGGGVVSVEQARVACEALLGQFLGDKAAEEKDQKEGEKEEKGADEENKAYQVGRTKVFLRHNIMDLLRRRQDAFFGASAAKIQAAARGRLGRKFYARAAAAVLLLQTRGRIVGARRGLRFAKGKAAKIQALVRGRQGKAALGKQRAACLVLGRHVRGW